MNVISSTRVGRLPTIRNGLLPYYHKLSLTHCLNNSGYISAKELLTILEKLDQHGDVRRVCPHNHIFCCCYKICSPWIVACSPVSLCAYSKEIEKVFLDCSCATPWPCYYRHIWAVSESSQHGYSWLRRSLWRIRKCVVMTPYVSCWFGAGYVCKENGNGIWSKLPQKANCGNKAACGDTTTCRSGQAAPECFLSRCVRPADSFAMSAHASLRVINCRASFPEVVPADHGWREARPPRFSVSTVWRMYKLECGQFLFCT